MQIITIRNIAIEGEHVPAGSHLDLPPALAAQLISMGRARAVGGKETATAPDYTTATASETATAPVEPVQTERPGAGVFLPDRLTAIKGIGARTAEALGAAGIWTFQQLAHADPDALAAALDGSSPAQVKRWQADAIGFLG